MCDELFESAIMNRRQFHEASLSMALTLLLPGTAKVLPTTDADVNVKTSDGKADCYYVHPVAGAHAGVIIWPDLLGLRPAFRKMGKRLAESGYSVLVVNPYYRQRHAPVVPAGITSREEAARKIVMPLAEALTVQRTMSDAKAFVEFMDDQRSVDRKRKIGSAGFSIGAPIVMRTAASIPNRIGASATFYGRDLVTNGPDSPHLLIPKMKGQFLVAIAEDDDQQDPAMKDTLKESFATANLPAEVEVYGAAHGWCSPDSAVYNKFMAERAWTRLLLLFNGALASN
jgi:carboxymethylenebutenolidase